MTEGTDTKTVQAVEVRPEFGGPLNGGHKSGQGRASEAEMPSHTKVASKKSWKNVVV